MKLRLHTIGAFLLLAGISSAAEEKISLKWDVKPQDRFEYQMGMTIDAGENGKVTATMHFAERILSVKDGVVTASMYVPGVSVQGSGLLGTAAGDELEAIKGLKYERSNELTGKSTAVMGAAALASGALDLQLPTAAVGIGDSWNAKFTPNQSVGEVEIKYTLESFTADSATIRGDLVATETIKPAKPYRFVVERASGRYRSAEGSLYASISGIELKLEFWHRTIYPAKLRPNGS